MFLSVCWKNGEKEDRREIEFACLSCYLINGVRNDIYNILKFLFDRSLFDIIFEHSYGRICCSKGGRC